MNQEPEFDPMLESNLRKVSPAKMDSSLAERIELAASKPKGHAAKTAPTWNWQLWLIPGTAIAAIALTLILNPSQTAPNTTSQPPTMVAAPIAESSEEKSIELFPSQRNNRVVNTFDEGFINLDNNPPLRKVRMQIVDSYTWEDPNGPTRVQYTIPREEHLLVPVKTH